MTDSDEDYETANPQDRLEELMDELSELRNSDELVEHHQGMLSAAEGAVATVFEQRQRAKYMNEWGDR